LLTKTTLNDYQRGIFSNLFSELSSSLHSHVDHNSDYGASQRLDGPEEALCLFTLMLLSEWDEEINPYFIMSPGRQLQEPVSLCLHLIISRPIHILSSLQKRFEIKIVSVDIRQI
jgi:hypothetical protein